MGPSPWNLDVAKVTAEHGTKSRDLMSVSMKPNHLLAMATLGVALGAVTGQALHAQATPPVYYVAEVDVTDLDGYLKEYAPKAATSSKDRPSLRARRSLRSRARRRTAALSS